MSETKSENMAEAIVESRYLSAGANRYAAAADWSDDGLVAFGSDSNVCLWDPKVCDFFLLFLFFYFFLGTKYTPRTQEAFPVSSVGTRPMSAPSSFCPEPREKQWPTL